MRLNDHVGNNAKRAVYFYISEVRFLCFYSTGNTCLFLKTQTFIPYYLTYKYLYTLLNTLYVTSYHERTLKNSYANG